MKSGKPLYGFMPWNDGFKTPMICTVVVLSFLMLFYCSAILDEKLTKRNPSVGKVKLS
jgi:hypothetical protein